MIAIIIPTRKCNLRCKHCMRKTYEEKELQAGTLKKFLSGFKEFSLEKNFSLTGGEPTIHSGFSDILETLREFDFRGIMVSNGQDLEAATKVVDFSDIFNMIIISLEGPDSATNDKIRGRGSFVRSLQSIDIYKKAGFKVQVQMTMNAHNIGKVGEMFKFADKQKINSLKFTSIEPCINTKKNKLVVSTQLFRRAREDFHKFKVKFSHIEARFKTRNMDAFSGPFWPSYLCRPVSDRNGEIVLQSNGNVSFCCDLYDFNFDKERYGNSKNFVKYEEVMGNIEREDFGIILNRRKDLIEKLIKRRQADFKNGLLLENRKFICENCKFYFC